jgi:hypothetical protein
MYVVEISPTLVTLILGDFFQNHLVTLVNGSRRTTVLIVVHESLYHVGELLNPVTKQNLNPKLLQKMGLASFWSIFLTYFSGRPICKLGKYV